MLTVFFLWVIVNLYMMFAISIAAPEAFRSARDNPWFTALGFGLIGIPVSLYFVLKLRKAQAK